MKIKHVLSIAPLALVSIGLTLSISSTSTSVEHVEVVQADSVSDYYKSISDSMTGDNLLGALNSLNNQKRTKMVGYASMRTLAPIFDADPNGSGKILGFYDNKLVGPDWDGGKTWNREHVWPNVRGGSKVEDDAHMTRPASTATNSDRGSWGFGTGSYDPGQFVAYYRGVASRIIFYAAIADTSLKLVDKQLNYNGGTPANSMGSLSDMLKWNLEYQPSDTSFTGQDDIARRAEINRNNAIHTNSKGQGNRNPFIDHPEYACRIWGNVNDATRKICGQQQVDTLTSFELNVPEVSMAVGNKLNLEVKAEPKDALSQYEIVWSSSNPNVASVTSSGAVTALALGETTITAKTSDNKYSASCKVTVSDSTPTPTPSSSSNGCGGEVVSTSIILSSISLLGIVLLFIKKLRKE